MAREEHFLGCNYSGGGSGGSGGGGGGSGGGDGSVGSGRLSKKVKQKKVPQRGLGVAQLEKIRLEEQQKMDSLEALSVLGRNPIDLPSDIAQFLPMNCPKFRSGLPSLYNGSNLPLPTVLYRQAPSVPSVIRNENLVHVSKQMNGNGGDMDSKKVSSVGQGVWPRSCNGECSVVGEKPRIEHHGLGCGTQMALLYEMNAPPILTTSIRSVHPFSQSPPPLIVNTSPGISQSPVLRSQIEPPSNQSSRGNIYTPSWYEEDKIVGVKRPYLFTLESAQPPSLHRNICSTYAATVSRSDDLVSSSNGYRTPMEPRNKCIREGPSSSNVPENSRLTGDFLTLGPPACTSPPSDSKLKRSLDCLSDQAHKLSKFESIVSQEPVGVQIYHPGPSESIEKSFTFFPVKHQIDQTTSCERHVEGEKGETIDLNLKL